MSKIKGCTFGTATIEYGEDPRGYLVAYAEGDAGSVYAVSRSHDVIEFAGHWATFGEGTQAEVGSGSTQEEAAAAWALIETERAIDAVDSNRASEDDIESLHETLDNILQHYHVDDRVAALRKLSSRAWNLGRSEREPFGNSYRGGNWT